MRVNKEEHTRQREERKRAEAEKYRPVLEKLRRQMPAFTDDELVMLFPALHDAVEDEKGKPA